MSAPNPKKKGHKGKGKLAHVVDRVLDIAVTAKEKIHPSSEFKEEGHEVPQDVAHEWGQYVLLPIQQYLTGVPANVPTDPRGYLNATVMQARQLGEKFGTTSPKGERREVPSLKPWQGAKGKYEPRGRTRYGQHYGLVDPHVFLTENVQEARRMGEQFGTTSPKEPYQKSQWKQPPQKPGLYQQPGVHRLKSGFGPRDRPMKRVASMNPREFLKENVLEARKLGEKYGTTSPEGRRKSQWQPQKRGTQQRGATKFGKMPPLNSREFLKENVLEARKLGEKYGTTSPEGRRKSQWQPRQGGTQQRGVTQQQKEPMEPAVFLKSTLQEARKLGEKYGTTSPEGRRKGQWEPQQGGTQQRGVTQQQQEPMEPAVFLKSTLQEARMLGEQYGTTSPKQSGGGKVKLGYEQFTGETKMKESVRSGGGEQKRE